MKKYIKSVFINSIFQIGMVLLFGVIKYLLVKFELSGKIQTPFLIIFSLSFLLLMIAIGISGIIENRGQSFESWEQESQNLNKNSLLIAFISWSKIIPLILGFLLFVYLIAPTSLDSFLILAGLIFIRNSIVFFASKKKDLQQEVQ